MRSLYGFFSAIVCVVGVAVLPVSAERELISNGGFETGSFTDWQRYVESGSPGNFQMTTDTLTPGEQFPTAGPASGDFYAVTDSNVPNTDGPSAYALLQSFTLPTSVRDTDPVWLQFSLFVNDWNGAGALNNGGALDYMQATPTQYARVDLLTATADPFSTKESDLVRTFYSGVDGLNPPSSYTDYSFNITAQTVPGQTYQLRFAAVANQFSLNMGVDSVSVSVGAPEPSAVTFLLPIVALVVRRRFLANRRS